MVAPPDGSEDEAAEGRVSMDTVLTIAVFAGMILAPCILAGCSRFFLLRLTILKQRTKAGTATIEALTSACPVGG
jgi:hypothetical protein